MHRFVYSILLCLLAAVGCSGQFLPAAEAPSAVKTRHFVMVTTRPDDSLVSLARTYLNDGDKAWQIAAFNDIEGITPGQKVVIPLVPMNPGGLYEDGYQTVPVLRYAGLTTKQSQSNAVYVRDFEQQMQYLNEYGFTTVSLDQFHAFLSQADQLPPFSVVVTFDTSRSWAYDIAFPVLKAHGMKAAFFIRPQDIGARGRLTWPQVAEMAAGGMNIGLYGSRIVPPAKEDAKAFLEAFEKEFTTPKHTFKSKIKRSCRYFAYAGGKSDDLTIAMLKKHGYRAGFTRQRGATPFFTHNFKIKRSTIYGHYNLEQFHKNLTTFRPAELK
jgi:peptidoglycan/xylan/chitin deacetylase (PgdA/CDA1 family)